MSMIKKNVEQLNQMILDGRAMNAFEKFYDEDARMQENAHEPTVGKAANRDREIEFFSSITEFRGAEVLNVITSGNQSFVIWHYDYTHKDWGVRDYQQLAIQTWNENGLIVEERFVYEEGDDSENEQSQTDAVTQKAS